MSARATPGPWHLHDTETATVCGPDGIAIACCEARSRTGVVQDANARLISAAPDLYEALEIALAMGGKSLKSAMNLKGQSPYDIGLVALAKARGEA